MRTIFLIFLLLIPFWPLSPPPSAQAQARCQLPSGYLEMVETDVDNYGLFLAQLDVNNAVDLADFFVEVAQIRHEYEDMTDNMPECGLRLHTLVIGLLANMQDMVGLALAILNNPELADKYLNKLEFFSARIALIPPQIEREVDLLNRLPPLAIRYVNTQAANVRGGPSANFESIGVVVVDTRIEVIAISLDASANSWYQFYYGEGTGWILGTLTSETPP